MSLQKQLFEICSKILFGIEIETCVNVNGLNMDEMVDIGLGAEFIVEHFNKITNLSSITPKQSYTWKEEDIETYKHDDEFKYGIAVDCRDGDFLAMDVHQWHCNSPIVGSGIRLSFVFYLREKMLKCCPNFSLKNPLFIEKY